MAQSVEDKEFWEQQRHSYQKKFDYLCNTASEIYSWEDPFEFYRNLFPEGFLERKGEMYNYTEPEGGHPNVIARVITDRMRKAKTKTGKEYEKHEIERYTITDDLDGIYELCEHSIKTQYPAYIAPVSYFGKTCHAKNARYLHAFCVDLDGVGIDQLWYVTAQIMQTVGPKPTEIVLSGQGLHLYFRLAEPVPLIPRNIQPLQEIKHFLTDRWWNRETSTIPTDKRQYQGIYQPFRMPGSITKLAGMPGQKRSRVGKDKYLAAAFRLYNQKPLTIDRFVDALPVHSDEYKVDIQKMWKMGGTVPLAIAKEQWPEWYESKIVRGESRRRWEKPAPKVVYDSWLKRITEGASVGHRYNCIMSLASYAAKCHMSYEEVEQDALGLLPKLQSLPPSPDYKGKKEFEEDELYAALDTFFEVRAVTYTNKFLCRRAGIEPHVNKRNYLPRYVHLHAEFIYVNGKRKRNPCRDNRLLNAGRHTKKDLIQNYAKEHPEANHSQIAKALGVSRKTVIKWLKNDGCVPMEHTPETA